MCETQTSNASYIRLLSCPTRMQGQGCVGLPYSSIFPVMDVSLLQTSLVHSMPEAVHPCHYWSSFCPGTSYFHLHVCFTLCYCSFRSISPYQRNLACLAFNLMFSTPKYLLIPSLLSLPPIHYIYLSPSTPLFLSPPPSLSHSFT